MTKVMFILTFTLLSFLSSTLHHVIAFQPIPSRISLKSPSLSPTYNINHKYRIINSKPSSSSSSLPVDPSFAIPSLDAVIHGIQNLDQFIQGALNSATSTPELVSSPPVLTNIPELNILNINTVGTEAAASGLNPLGNDLLIFLCATIGIVPLFKWLKASAVIGFLAAGLLMGPAGLGLFLDLPDMESIADFGVLFLLFEQGLELTVDRLKSLSKFAFGMGTLQVVLSTAAFFTFPFIGGVQFLEFITQSTADFVDIERVDEALVIGAALSLSSSAFVLKVLQEKGQLQSKFGAASLGILLLQDIAVVPLLVLLPIIESNSGPMPLSAQLSLLGATFLKAILGLGGILVIGGNIVRFLFSLIAQTRSSETFVALCLLVALGTGALTDSLGLSSTLGAFTAGTLLAESNYRTQIESDIKPFRGLLLGLFFLTTGASVDPVILQEQWQTVLALLIGLLTFKTIIITALGPFFGLSKSESVRTGLLLSGGGEFAFVVLTLADKLHVLPDTLSKVLVGVVVISMALTPTLSNLGDKAAAYLDKIEQTDSLNQTFGVAKGDKGESVTGGGFHHTEETDIVICGFEEGGQTIASFLTSPGITDNSVDKKPIAYTAFDLDPNTVVNAFKNGFKVLYGDGSQPMVLVTAGITSPKLFVVTHSDSEVCFKAVERLHASYPSIPIIARACNNHEYYHLLEAGATHVIPVEQESALSIGAALLNSFGVDNALSEKLKNQYKYALQQESDNKFQSMQLKKGYAYNNKQTDRINSKDSDDVFNNGMTSVQRMLSNVQRKFNSVIDADFKLQSDDDDLKKFAINTDTITSSNKSSDDASAAIITAIQAGDVASLDDVNDALINSLGVTLCPLPPKVETSSSTTSNLK